MHRLMQLVLFLCCLLCLFFYIILFIWGCAGSSLLRGLSSSFGKQEQGPLSSCGAGLLVAVAPLVVEHRSRVCGLSSCGSSAVGNRFHSCGAWA